MRYSELIGILTTLILIKITYPFTKYLYISAKNKLRDLIMYPRQNRRYINDEQFLKRGGYIAGLVNDGNTCFMNSVFQSLASSRELLEFLDSMVENYGGEKRDLAFSATLLELLGRLNMRYGRERPYFKTNKILKTMSNGPNRNIILGYDQEDAQEFFQQILADLEKNVKLVKRQEKEEEGKEEDGDNNNEKERKGKANKNSKRRKRKAKNDGAGHDDDNVDEKKEQSTKKPVHVSVDELPNDALLGHENLDKVGVVYVPTEQIEPNLVSSEEKKFYTPFELITPLDGMTAERIGCLNCGENGGIRYSVFSGLSLNLPSESLNAPTVKLSSLLDEWIKPEIIEGVECNRCSLVAIRERLQQQLETKGDDMPKKLAVAIENRIAKLDEVLSKPAVDGDDYKRLQTENMVHKVSKTKQILMSRPPPLLSIHINRSVFDPRTFAIRKNNARVLFKLWLNLDRWCCSPSEVNLDARLPMSKKVVSPSESSEDEAIGGEYYSRLHHKFEQEFEDSDDEDDDDDEDDEEDMDVDFSSMRRRDNPNYDPLNSPLDEDENEYDEDFSDGSSEGDYIEETDALGNTIRRRRVPEVNGNDTKGLSVGRDGQVSFNKSRSSSLSSVEGGGSLDRMENINSEEEDEVEDEDEVEGREQAIATGVDTGAALQKESDSEVEDNASSVGTSDVSPSPPPPALSPAFQPPANPTPLTYALRSVIVHYGTHNYGHYIAFRKYRGYWWRISDETVYIVNEEEVLSTPGVFMLFYEYDYDEETGKMRRDVDPSPEDIEISVSSEQQPLNEKAELVVDNHVSSNDGEPVEASPEAGVNEVTDAI